MMEKNHEGKKKRYDAFLAQLSISIYETPTHSTIEFTTDF